MPSGNPTIFGVRHHGPGSSRSLLRSLEKLEPDCILIEGPPDADGLMVLAHQGGLTPPVALLVYSPKSPNLAAFYPLAEYSPEWNAMQFALSNEIPVRFMDLPQAHQLAIQEQETRGREESGDGGGSGEEGISLRDEESPVPEGDPPPVSTLRQDPLGWLARAAGYGEGEEWWEHMIEMRRDEVDLFAAVLEAMRALREEAEKDLDGPPDPEEARREAFMRRTLRKAMKEGFHRIAVVCGAWHAPALADMPTVKQDNETLKGLPKTTVEATWIPWTNGRLSAASGYGAGVRSPGWYQHLWRTSSGGNGSISAGWLTRVAHLLRKEGLDCSPAHIIESTRLADSLAALRQRPHPGLMELTEAVLSCVCAGDETPLRLIEEKLIVGEALGEVGEGLPQVPLQIDLQQLQKRLRLKPEASRKVLDLDLRKPNDLQRSYLLHRLDLLGIPWGELEGTGHGKKGTFHEIWELEWKPEFAVNLIEAAQWGNTVEEASGNYAIHEIEQARNLPAATGLIRQVLLADLSDAVPRALGRLNDLAALTSNIPELMDSIPPLADVMRYGDVRQTDTTLVDRVMAHMLTRVCVGLSAACYSLDDEAAQQMAGRLRGVTAAVRLLQNDEYATEWYGSLGGLIDLPGLHGLASGTGVRLLLDAGELPADEAARRMGLALSPVNEPSISAGWLEGFLKDSGMILLHDDNLWGTLDQWVCTLTADQFQNALPLIRRSFATFQDAERRQIGERVKGAARATRSATIGDSDENIDEARGGKVLPIAAMMLGIEKP